MLTDIKVPRDLGHDTGEAAVQTLKKSQVWKPEIQNGKPVRVQYNLPLSLRLNKSENSSSDSLKPTSRNILLLPNPPLTFVDSKGATAERLAEIKNTDIELVQVFKDKRDTDKYGEQHSHQLHNPKL